MHRQEHSKEGLRSTRIPTEYHVNYSMGDISGEGYITDISEDGVAMRSNQVFVAGDKLQVTAVVSSNLVLEFEGEVRNIQGNKIGLLITDIDPETHERFLSHIDALLRMMNKKKNELF